MLGSVRRTSRERRGIWQGNRAYPEATRDKYSDEAKEKSPQWVRILGTQRRKSTTPRKCGFLEEYLHRIRVRRRRRAHLARNRQKYR